MSQFSGFNITKDLQQSISNQTSVSLEIAKNVLLKEALDSNIVFSPLSLYATLSLVAVGSDGPTRDQILSFMRSNGNGELNSFVSEIVSFVLADGTQSGGPRLCFVNGAWVDMSTPLTPSFKQIVDNVYKAESTQVDFITKPDEVRNEVNSWAEKQTSGLIRELLPLGSVDTLTRLIFANALYFNGAWNEKFDPWRTRDHEFYLLDGSRVSGLFMTSNKKQYVEAYDGFKVLRLPYKQGEDKRSFSMYMFLPDAIDGLPGLIEKVGSEDGFLDRYLPSEAVPVGPFRIPRFRISFGFESSKILKDLGLVLPFLPGGFIKMVDSPRAVELCVSGIFQKSFINVNEEGTEASAACAVVFMMQQQQCQPIGLIDFVADHPFLYLIREDTTGVVLFIGHVMNPNIEEGNINLNSNSNLKQSMNKRDFCKVETSINQQGLPKAKMSINQQDSYEVETLINQQDLPKGKTLINHQDLTTAKYHQKKKKKTHQ